jgi:uncharacterized membrane protein (DUF2068 family)
LILAIIELVLAWGLWTLQRWAFWATVIIAILEIIDGLFGLSRGGGAGMFAVIVDIVIPVIVLIYMFADRNVRAAFRT